jgi:hypothetical protein
MLCSFPSLVCRCRYWIKAAGKEHGSSVSEDVDRDGEPLTTVDDENEMKFSIG